MQKVTMLGIDLAKTSFHIHGCDASGKKIVSKALKRNQLELFVTNLEPCTIAMEACGSAHWWARRFVGLGHSVKLIAPQFVKPFVKGNKNDRADAEAIAEAASRPTMRFVPIKNSQHLDVQAIHRVRSRLVSQRTALTNEMRGLLYEHGVVLAQGIATLRTFVLSLVHGDVEGVTPMCKETMADLLSELSDLEERIAVTEKRLKHFSGTSETVARLLTVPGIGLITATALLAAVPDASAFTNGRQFAAWIGLVPKHSGSGGADKNRMGRISKRGDAYLRRLLVHGARSVLKVIDRRTDRYGKWAANFKSSKGWNKTVVAMANKNARIIWSLMVSAESFQQNHMPALKKVG